MKVHDLFAHGLTMEHSLSEMVELMAAIAPLNEAEDGKKPGLHFTRYEGEEHHNISDQPHTQKALDHVDDRIAHHMSKLDPKRWPTKQHAADHLNDRANDNGMPDHELAKHSEKGEGYDSKDHPLRNFKKPDHTHTTEQFAKKAAKEEHERAKDEDQYNESVDVSSQSKGSNKSSPLMEATVGYLNTKK